MRIFLFAVLFLLTAQFSAMAQGAQRASKPAFKGVELYSWKSGPANQWSYSLLPGTNRNKTLAEITEPRNAISGVNELKVQLAKLAKGEQVFWTSMPGHAEPSYPTPEVVADIVRYAAERRVEVYAVGQ